jgi:anti-sigma factor RsiW
MFCAHSWEELGAYVDQEADCVSRTEVSDHLAACPTCAAICEQIREQSALIRSVETYRASGRLCEAIARATLQTSAKPDAQG